VMYAELLGICCVYIVLEVRGEVARGWWCWRWVGGGEGGMVVPAGGGGEGRGGGEATGLALLVLAGQMLLWRDTHDMPAAAQCLKWHVHTALCCKSPLRSAPAPTPLPTPITCAFFPLPMLPPPPPGPG
jgi:hypothetical protein